MLLANELVAVLGGMGEHVTFAVSLVIPFSLLASLLVVCMLGMGVVASVV